MRVITLLAAIMVTFTSCNCQKKAAEKNNATSENTMKQEAMPTLEYEANTRGFYNKITIANQMMSVISVRDGKPTETKISDADWAELTALYKAVNKEGLRDLKAPSDARFYDGAAMANFRVITKESTFESATFDAGNPPAEIEKIVNKLIAIADKQK